MATATTLPPGTASPISPGTGRSSLDSPNINPGNRARSNRARTKASNRARARARGNPATNRQRFSNYQKAKASQSRLTAPKTPTTGNPTVPIPKGVPAAAASGSGFASIWSASPASAPFTTAVSGAAAFGAGLGFGNFVYEDVLRRPWGPSLGDYFRDSPLLRDGPAEQYFGPGPTVTLRGQAPVSYTLFVDFERVRHGRVETGSTGGICCYTGPLVDFTQTLSANRLKQEFHVTSQNAGRVMIGSVFFDNGTTVKSTFTPVRRDGLPDIPVEQPGTPQEINPSPPRRAPRDPLPQNPARTSPTPEQEAPAPAVPAVPKPDFSDPFPELRPISENPGGFPTPLPLPARAPSPKPTPSPTTSAPPGATTPPPTTKARPNCGCNPAIAASVANKLEPLLQGQQAQNKIIGSSLGGDGAILAKLIQMQQFAETAWQNSRLNKIINLLTLISVLHNAAMLSRNVGETIGELTSQMLAVVGIKDEGGSPIDINELISGSIEDFVKSVVGDDVYNDVSTSWQKASRVVASASNIVYTIRSIHDTSKDVMEWTAENTGKIGNALKRWGVVGERAYPWMSERVRAQDAYRRKFQRVTDGLEALEDTASSLSQVTGDVREIQDEFTELGEQRDAFKELVGVTAPEATATAAPENVPIAEAAGQAALDSQSPDVSIRDAQNGG